MLDLIWRRMEVVLKASVFTKRLHENITQTTLHTSQKQKQVSDNFRCIQPHCKQIFESRSRY